jgi:prepilin-type N-terminal cleavage/methylation domain-containing protein
MRPDGKRSGFTLIELITVIAVIAILSTILISSVGGANASAKKAKTRAQFSQWGSAIELFRQEYGYYPDFDAGIGGTFDSVINSQAESELFMEALGGRAAADNAPLVSGDRGFLAGNTKSIRFLSFGTDDPTDEANPQLQDGFGNTEIALLFDRDYDGMIEIGPGEDYGTAPPVSTFSPSLGSGDVVRTGVIFYSPGVGKSNTDVVKSWE